MLEVQWTCRSSFFEKVMGGLYLGSRQDAPLAKVSNPGPARDQSA
jgi:hypothetical protein